MKKHLFCIVLLGCCQCLTAQSPWTRAKKAGFVQLSSNYIRANAQFNDSSKVIETPYTVTDIHVSLYADYGITDRLTLALDVPFKILTNTGGEVKPIDIRGLIGGNGDQFSPQPTAVSLAAGSQTSLGAIGLTAKYRIVQSPLVISAQLRGDIPTRGSFQITDNTGLNTNEPAYKITPSVLFGGGSNRIFGAGEVGFAYRPTFYNDFIANAQVGVSFLQKRLYIILPVQYRQALNGGNSWSEGIYTGLYAPRQSYLAIGLKGFYNITSHVGVSAYMFGATSGRNIAAAPSFGVGVHYKWGE